MRIAIISDIHGNYEALKAVLADIDKSKVDAIFCLGDLVGYGPMPNEVIEEIVKRKIPCVIGNHELAVLDDYELNQFNGSAYDSTLITRKLLSKKSMDFIRKLPKNLIKDSMLFVHGCPPDDVLRYMFELTENELTGMFNYVKKIAFVGHMHLLLIYPYDKEAKKIGKGIVKLDKNKKYIISAGSVGQPRDGNNNAKYVIFDDNEFSIEARFVPYNIKKTADLIIKLGFPKFNAERLF